VAPAGPLVLVDEERAHALEELLAGHEPRRQAELEPHRLLERQRRAEADLGQGDVQAERRLGGEPVQDARPGVTLAPQPLGYGGNAVPGEAAVDHRARGRERGLPAGLGREPGQHRFHLGRRRAARQGRERVLERGQAVGRNLARADPGVEAVRGV
jgi:hypothetical protein